MSFHGIIPPLATPFKDNEDLDIERLKWFIEQQIEAGVHGIFVLGTNSEFYAMDEAENPIHCIPHLYWMYTKGFSNLRCCGWSYGCIIIAVLHVQVGGGF